MENIKTPQETIDTLRREATKLIESNRWLRQQIELATQANKHLFEDLQRWKKRAETAEGATYKSACIGCGCSIEPYTEEDATEDQNVQWCGSQCEDRERYGH